MINKQKDGKESLMQFIKKEEKSFCKFGIQEELTTVKLVVDMKFGVLQLFKLESSNGMTPKVLENTLFQRQ